MTANVTPPRLWSWAGSACAIGVILGNLFVSHDGNASLRSVGAGLLLLSAVFMFLPFWLLLKHGQPEEGQSYIHTTVVVDRGLYAIVRHPQYLGYMLLMVGFVLLSQHWALVFLAAAGIGCYYAQAVAEERYLVRRGGDAYAAYLEQVPRFNMLRGVIRVLLSKKRQR